MPTPRLFSSEQELRVHHPSELTQRGIDPLCWYPCECNGEGNNECGSYYHPAVLVEMNAYQRYMGLETYQRISNVSSASRAVERLLDETGARYASTIGSLQQAIQRVNAGLHIADQQPIAAALQSRTGRIARTAPEPSIERCHWCRIRYSDDPNNGLDRTMWHEHNGDTTLLNHTPRHCAACHTNYCWICPECNTSFSRVNVNGLSTEPCTNTDCRMCSSCCACASCSSCGMVYSRATGRERCHNNECNWCCGECNSANDDYDSPGEERDGYTVPTHQRRRVRFYPATKPAERVKNRLQRIIAAEIEVAGASSERGIRKLNEVCQRWSITVEEDGSLTEGGFELAISPAAGDHLINQIKDVTEALRAAEAHADSTCGLHVHVDARDFTYFDIRRLLYTYAAVEPALFSMVPGSRRRSSYCSPCATDYINNGIIQPFKKPKSKDLLKIAGTKTVRRTKSLRQSPPLNTRLAVARATYGSGHPIESLRNLKRTHKPDCRYRAMNLHSWFYRGSIEFRLPPGSINEDKIRQWCLTYGWMVESAYRMNERQAESLYTTRNATAVEKLKWIVPPSVGLFVDQRITTYGNGDRMAREQQP